MNEANLGACCGRTAAQNSNPHSRGLDENHDECHHGLKSTKKILGRFAQMGVDLILCGHDHQESVHYIEHTKKGTVISTAGTVSNRSRGGRPSSVNVISIGPSTIDVTTRIWSDESSTFVPGPHRCFDR